MDRALRRDNNVQASPEWQTLPATRLLITSAQFASVIFRVLCLDTGYKAWLGPSMHPALVVISMVAYCLGFAYFAMAARQRGRLDRVIACGLFILFVLQVLVRIQTEQMADQYGTDALAFNHYSAQVFLAGHNPYLVLECFNLRAKWANSVRSTSLPIQLQSRWA